MDYIKIKIDQGTAEWDSFRRTHIGASEAPAICGVDPYKKPEKLWKQKFTGEKQSVSPSMLRGKKLEPIARAMLEKANGVIYETPVLQSNVHNWMIASLDGFHEVNKVGIEIKCPGDKVFNQIIIDRDIPKHYIYQIQHQMYVTGFNKWVLVPFNGIYFEECIIYRDESIIEEILRKEKHFYECLLYGEFSPYEN